MLRITTLAEGRRRRARGARARGRSVAEAMRSFARSRPLYLQVRYIDEDGRERVRVDARGGGRALVDAPDVPKLEPGGPTFIARLAEGTERAAIVVLTMHVTRAERSALLGAGASAVLLKDLDTAALVDAIHAVARNKSGVDA